jgi:hypothetical protein
MSILRSQLQQVANEMLSWAQANHPWTNRTHAAEMGLDIDVTHGGRRITLGHGAPHGVFLEFKHGGRWGVIRPTMEAFAPRYREAMQTALSEAGFA